MSRFSVVFLSVFFSFQIAYAELKQIPTNCRGKVYPCVLFAKDSNEQVEGFGAHVTLASGASLQIENANKFNVMRGLLYVNSTSEDIKLHFLYGHVHIVSGQVLIQTTDEKVRISNLTARMSYTPKGGAMEYNLPEGFQTYLARVGERGYGLAGFPQPVDVDAVIPLWSQFYSRSTKDIFKQDLESFKAGWVVATQSVRPWYEDTIRREIAAEAEAKKRREIERARRDAQNQVYRRMFRERFFNP